MIFLEFLGILFLAIIAFVFPRTVCAILAGIILGGSWWILMTVFIVIGLIADFVFM